MSRSPFKSSPRFLMSVVSSSYWWEPLSSTAFVVKKRNTARLSCGLVVDRTLDCLGEVQLQRRYAIFYSKTFHPHVGRKSAQIPDASYLPLLLELQNPETHSFAFQTKLSVTHKPHATITQPFYVMHVLRP